MHIRVDRAASSAWHEVAERCGLFYHHPAWIETLARCFRFEVWYFTAYQDERAVGILPLALVPAITGRRRLVSLPFSYATGIAAESREAEEALAAAAIRLTQQVGARRLELKSVSASDAPPGAFTRASRYDTYRLPRTPAHTDPLGAASQSHRRAVRQAEREGVVVQTGSGEDWLRMAMLQEVTSHRLGLPAPPRDFFVHGCAGLERQELAELMLARAPGGEIAAAIVIWKGWREWIYAFGASRPDMLHLRPNHALLAQAIRNAAAQGVVFDLGRAAREQEGLVEFKRRWGAEPVPLAYDYWPSVGGLHAASRNAGALALAGRVWSALPESVARRGAFLYRYLG